MISLFLSSQRNKFNRAPHVSVFLLGFHDYDAMYLMIDSERRGIFIGQAKSQKKKNKAGEMFCKEMTAPRPQHVKEALLLAARLCLLHPEDGHISRNEDMRDTAMEVIHKNKSKVKVLNNNSVATVNNQILKTLVKILSVSFLMVNFGPVITASMKWPTTSEEVQSMLKHSQKVLIHSCQTHDDPKCVDDYFPEGMCLHSFDKALFYHVMTSSIF